MRAFAIVLASTLVGGCVPSRTTGGPLPGSEIVTPAADSTQVATALPYAWTADAFTISIEVRTEQADSTAVDSLRRDATVHFTPQKTDSGYVFLFEASRDSVDAASPLTLAATRLIVDTAGNSAVDEGSMEDCSTRLPEVSPVLVRQLAFPLDPRHFLIRTQFTDSIAYTSCVQGVRVRSQVELTWTQSPAYTNAGQRQFTVQLKGKLQADSSRQLPMNLSGNISGASILIFDSQALRLVTLESQITSGIEATSGTLRRQQFRQTVSYRARIDSTASVH